MESIILPPPPTLLTAIDASQPSHDRNNSLTRSQTLASFSATRDSSISWGRRAHHGSWLHAMGCLSIMLLCPCLVIFIWISLDSFDGSLMEAMDQLWLVGPVGFFARHVPSPSIKASVGYGLWILFQIALYRFLPSKISTGQLTPDGNLLHYRTNGLLAWAVTHVLFAGLVLMRYIDPAILAKHWEGLLVAANISGFLLSGLAFGKAHLSPTHEGDRKFSGKLL